MSNSFFFLLLVQFFSLLHNSYAKPQSSLSKHFSQRVEHHDQPFLVSQDQTFSCGFYSAGTNAFVFSIWFTNSINKTIVWTANRDSPVNGHGSEMSFRHGNLVLKDVNGSTVWSTSLTTSGDESTISLLNTGNLVIKSHGITIWQTFDSPTDTLLPNQPLSKETKVISALERGGISSGYYWLLFDNDNVLKLIYDGPDISSIYWPDPNPATSVFAYGRTYYNSTRLAVLNETGSLISSDGLSVFASDFGPGIRRRLTVDYDGNLRIYSLNTSDGTWEVTWEAMQQLCNVHGLCGQNAICEYSPGLMCSCLPGHEMYDPSNWNRGCRPTYSFSCNQTESRFVEVPKVDFYGFDLWYTTSISFHDCKLLCLQNCTCMGFSYRLDGEGVCYPKGTLFNGNKVSSFPGNFYLRLPIHTNNSILDTRSGLNCTNSSIVIVSSSTFDTSRNSPQWTYVFVFAAVLGALEIILVVIGWWYLFKDTDVPKSVEEGYKMISSQFRRFTYRELKEVTGKFKEEIGRGFSGVVYRGVLDDKRVVAVKKLTDVTQGEEEFWAEVSVIGKINHMNLVRMFGFCSESQQYLLVYEYIKNRSLDKHLFESNMILQWKERLKIALGTAKGLAYLHHECLEWIIHCDVKPENILVTSDFEPKIADFGLAKLSKRDGPDFNFSHMRGTIGYMAPEWALSLPITSKVDVYSYGVVLLEIVTGSRVSGGILNDGQEMSLRNFADAVKQVLACGDESAVTGLVDIRLQGQFDLEQAATMLRVAMTCLEEEQNQRPTMDEVVKHLSVFVERDELSLGSW